MSRHDQYDVRVILDGTGTGTWDKMSGGGIDSDETKYKPGGLAPQITLGGTTSSENITVSRLYDLDRDHNGLVRNLLSRVGKGRVKINKQPLDTDGVPFGDPLVYKGILKKCSPPDVDSQSGDAAMLEIEVSVAGSVG